jgi:putative hydrolase of the HAD superfamily
MIPSFVRAVVFDAVGTLLHPSPPAPEAYFRVARRYGSRLSLPDIAQRFRNAFATEERRDQEIGNRTDEQREVRRWRQIVATVLEDVHDGEACFQELFHNFAQPQAWALDERAGPVLEQLAQRGYILGLASNFDRRLRSVVAGFPALRPVQHLIISSEVGWRKPSRLFFQAVIEAVGVNPQEILFVGDDPINDYGGARLAGLVAALLDPDLDAGAPPAPHARLNCLLDLCQH